MSYKENLLKKIDIDRLVNRVITSIGSPDSGRKLDKEAMRRLLDMAGYTHRHERDLDLYLENGGATKGLILVLDNDLTIYDTTVEDVIIRKSPVLKEMVSIRNIIKILNDKDVVVSRKEASVMHVREECVEQLDLSHTAQDIGDIEKGLQHRLAVECQGLIVGRQGLFIGAILVKLLTQPAPQLQGHPHVALRGNPE